MSDDEFFQMTPRQYHILLAQQQQQTEHQEFLFGQVCSMIANWSMGAPKKPLKLADFMPSHWIKTPPKRTRRPSQKELAAKVRALFGKKAVTVPRAD